MHTDRCGNTCRQKCCAKGSGKEDKIQEFMYRDKTNEEPEMYDYTNNKLINPKLICAFCWFLLSSIKIQEFMYGDTTNVEPEMYDYTSNNWSH